MMKLLVTLTAVLVAVGAYAQGKLGFQVNTTQLIYMTPGTPDHALNPADVGKTIGGFALAGSSLYTGVGSTIASLAGAPTFTVALFGGATAGSLTQVATT